MVFGHLDFLDNFKMEKIITDSFKKWHILKGQKTLNHVNVLKWDYEDHRPVEASLQQGMGPVMIILVEIATRTLIS
jgi:hypothetical protein